MALPRGIWSTRDASDLISDTQGEEGLTRSIGASGLTAHSFSSSRAVQPAPLQVLR